MLKWNMVTIINIWAGKSVIDYAIVSEGLIDKVAEFKIGNEIISCHMPLVVVLGDITYRKADTNVTVRDTGHKSVKYRWDEKAKLEFLDILNSNINEYCMHGIKLLLQNGKINEAQNILLFFGKEGWSKNEMHGEEV
jgi:hypothetical protein